MSDQKHRVGLLASEQPPPDRKSSAIPDILNLVTDLRGQPHTWFRVAEFTSRQSASGVATKLRKKVPEVEWTSRSFEGGSILWARWVGGANE
jgi:hypothetical protein